MCQSCGPGSIPAFVAVSCPAVTVQWSKKDFIASTVLKRSVYPLQRSAGQTVEWPHCPIRVKHCKRYNNVIQNNICGILHLLISIKCEWQNDNPSNICPKISYFNKKSISIKKYQGITKVIKQRFIFWELWMSVQNPFKLLIYFLLMYVMYDNKLIWICAY